MLKFLGHELKWYSLKYKKSNNERGFQLEKEGYQSRIFTLFFSLLTIITFFFWIGGYGNSNPYTLLQILLNITRLASPFLVHFIVRCQPKFVEETIIISISSSIVFYI